MSFEKYILMEKTRLLQAILPSILIGWLVVQYYISNYRPSQIEHFSKLHEIVTSQAISNPNHPINVEVVKKNIISRKTVQHIILKPSNLKKTKPKIGRVNSACDLLNSRRPLDTKHVINHPTWHINTVIPKTDCNANVYLVIYVHTSPDNHHRRNTIRRTWGNTSQYNVPIRLVFVVGARSGVELERSPKDAVENEIKIYGDIIKSNFMDTYRALSHKAIAGLKWVTKHCRSTKYVLKTDDDAFVNVYLLLHLLRTETELGHYKENLLLCNVRNRSVGETIINRSGKWKTTNQECSLKYFPTFCQGIAFVMTVKVAVALLDASKYVPLLWMDDVYLTGFLPALLASKTVVHLDAGTFYMSTGNINKTTSRKVLSSADVFKFIYYHEDDTKLFGTAWNNLKRVVPTQEFSNYTDALFSKDMQLERKRLKNITCTAWSRARDLCYIPPN